MPPSSPRPLIPLPFLHCVYRIPLHVTFYFPLFVACPELLPIGPGVPGCPPFRTLFPFFFGVAGDPATPFVDLLRRSFDPRRPPFLPLPVPLRPDPGDPLPPAPGGAGTGGRAAGDVAADAGEAAA